MRLVVSLLALAALACSDEKKEPLSDPGPGCSAAPLSCPAGTTCWPFDISGRYECSAAPETQLAGTSCTIDLGKADCAPGLFCYPTSDKSGVCSPFCETSEACGGAACNAIWVVEAEYRYDVRVCAAAAPADAGTD